VNYAVTADNAGTTAVLDGFDVRNAGTITGASAGVLVANCSPRIAHCVIRDNAADAGAGAYITGGGSVLFQDCLFERNTANAGSAVRSFSGSGMTVTMRRCAVIGNSSAGGTAGTIGLWCNVVMENCLVANNDEDSWIMDLSPSPSVTLLSCTFANNRAVNAGGPSMVGVALGHANTIRNCIIWGNEHVGGPTPAMSGVLYQSAGSSLTITDSIVQQWDGSIGTPADANLAVDPRFVDPAAAGNTASALLGDYHLASRSPARDSGWNVPAPAGPDLGGFARIYDDPYFPNTGYAGGTIDRGCYEAFSASGVCPGDIGSTGGVLGPDGSRDNNDFVVFINEFFLNHAVADVGRTGGIAPGDGAWDNNDFVVFIDLFFSPCP
jgi:hypothetical protein